MVQCHPSSTYIPRPLDVGADSLSRVGTTVSLGPLANVAVSRVPVTTASIKTSIGLIVLSNIARLSVARQDTNVSRGAAGYKDVDVMGGDVTVSATVGVAVVGKVLTGEHPVFVVVGLTVAALFGVGEGGSFDEAGQAVDCLAGCEAGYDLVAIGIAAEGVGSVGQALRNDVAGSWDSYSGDVGG